MLERVQRALGTVGLSLDVQNLDTKPGDGIFDASGSVFRHGRLWIRERTTYDSKLQLEWVLRAALPGFGLHVTDDEVVVRCEGLAGVVYASVPIRNREIIELVQQLAGVERYDDVSIIDARFHHGAFWWRFMHSLGSWKSGTPWWRYGSLNFEDLLLGRSVAEDKVLGPCRDVDIPMPEGPYRWRAQRQRRTVRRRWKTEIFTVVELDCHEGQQIPVPGKGESSWDCGADAVYSTSVAARNAEEAIGKLVGSLLHDRQRRGAGHTYVDGGVYDQRRAS